MCIYGNWRGRGPVTFLCRHSVGRLQRLQILVALLGTVVPGKTVRPVSSSYLSKGEQRAGRATTMEDTSKKGGHPEGDCELAKFIKSTLLSIDGDSWRDLVKTCFSNVILNIFFVFSIYSEQFARYFPTKSYPIGLD